MLKWLKRFHNYCTARYVIQTVYLGDKTYWVAKRRFRFALGLATSPYAVSKEDAMKWIEEDKQYVSARKDLLNQQRCQIFYIQ